MRVRLILNPTRIGVLTGREVTRGDRVFYQVQFPDNLEFKPKDQLEKVPENETPIDMLANNKFGTASDLRKVLIHAKVSGRMADVVYSMNATNTDFYAYQFKPVLKILDSPSNSLLIADEVGLGKTIEAGLIWTELRMRYNFNRLMILCPAALREKWQNELSKRFGIECSICDAAETLGILKGKAKSKSEFAIIGSIQGLRPVKNNEANKVHKAQAELAKFFESKENDEPIIDLLIIDEAHHMRNPNKTRELGHLASEVSEYTIFLTATPIHNKNSDLFSLLQLLDPNTFSNEYAFDNILSANIPLIKARDLVLGNEVDSDVLLKIVHEAQKHPLLEDNNQLKNILEFIRNNNDLSKTKNRSLLAHKLEYVNLLSNVLTRTRKRDVLEWRVLRQPIAEFVRMTKSERQFYEFVSNIIIEYAQNCDINERFLLAQPQRQITSSIPASLQAWKDRWNNGTESERNDDIGPLSSEIINQTVNCKDFDLNELIDNDSKYNKLKRVLSDILEKNSKEKIVLFSTFRATLFYLNDKLSKDEISSIVMVGGQTQSKDEVIKEFAKEMGPSVLLSSEVGSEGVDMQFARIVINYDLPWNPMKVEQRIGRIDRLGQEAEQIFIWNLFYNETIDSRVYKRLYVKLNLIQNSLGDFEAVLGEKIKKLEIDLLSSKLTPEEQKTRINQTAMALENLKKTEEELENQAANLVAYGDYVLNQIHTARDLQRWITAEDIRQYITDHLTLHYQGSKIEPKATDNTFSISLAPDAKARFMKFAKEINHAKSSFNNPHLNEVTCRFDNKVYNLSNGREEVINQFHPLVKWVSYEISQNTNPLRPAVAVKLDNDKYDVKVGKGIYLICINKWMFDGVRKIERLEYRGIKIDPPTELDPELAEKLSITAALQGSFWYNVEEDPEKIVNIANDQLLSQLQSSYEEFVSEQSAKNEDRLQIQKKNNQDDFERRFKTLEELKLNYEQKGKERLLNATEGRIKALKTRTEIIDKQIELNREFKSESSELAIALIKIL